MEIALTIAGSDSSGGAGIQADLKTFQEKNVYGMTALTVVVAMDPENNWNHQVFPVDTEVIRAQLSTIVDGIGVDAMKTGMLPTVDIIELAADTIKKIHAAINATPPSGVIAPRTLICVRLRTYKLPENKTIPANISHPAAETLPAPASFDAMSATAIKPSA